MSVYQQVAKYNFRHNLLPHVLAGGALLLLTPVLFHISALDSAAAALPLELCLPFLGVILLTPIYAQEHESSVLDVITARQVPYTRICGIRIGLSLLAMLLMTCGFVDIMILLESDVGMAHALASFAGAVFLGGLGIFGTAVFGNVVLGYMVPVFFFILDLMGAFGSITLLSMMRFGTMDGKLWWFLAGIGLVFLAQYVRASAIARR